MMDVVGEIKRRLNIIEVITAYVPLQKAGSNWRARCPFHQEKSPSFMVSEDKQMWHCFGCSEGGDMFTFLQKIEGIEFPEALRILAERAHVPLSKTDPRTMGKRTRVLDVLAAAQKWYKKGIHEVSGSVAREYVKKRGVDPLLAEEFGLGFALNAWDATGAWLRAQGFSETEMVEAGLRIRREGGKGFYDRFRNRLMFPIHDVQGNIIAFGGRTLDSAGEGAKYLNSPETSVYHKGSVLYNLHRARGVIRSEQKVLVVEGYMDALTVYGAGIHNVVASSGTALTSEHIELLKRYAKNFVFAFDADIAGQQAARRAVGLAWRAGVTVRVLVPPNGKDPDESIRKSANVFREAFQKAPLFLDYFFEKQLTAHNIRTIEGKKSFALHMLEVVRDIPDPIEVHHYLQKTADVLDIDVRDLKRTMLRSGSVSGRSVRTASDVTQKPFRPGQLHQLFALILQHPRFLPRLMDRLDMEAIQDAYLQNLYKNIIIYYTQHRAFQWDDFQKTFDISPISDNTLLALLLLGERLYADSDDEFLNGEFQRILMRFEKEALMERMKSLEREMRSAELAGDASKLKVLSESFGIVLQKLQHLS